jgi:uncharacterized protein (DUF433 family)
LPRAGLHRCVDDIAAGVSHEEILRSYPALTGADIEATPAYAA